MMGAVTLSVALKSVVGLKGTLAEGNGSVWLTSVKIACFVKIIFFDIKQVSTRRSTVLILPLQ
jgi:hypothetical protein